MNASPQGQQSPEPLHPALHHFPGIGPVARPAIQSTSILIVEDNEACAATLACTLEFLGHPYRLATTGEAALQILDQYHHRLHCVLLDLELPDMSGAELCRLSTLRWPGLRFILCTGQDEVTIRELHPHLCWMAFLHKPYAFADLRAALATLPARPQRGPRASSNLSLTDGAPEAP
jgi:DNA-binding response OmpR family regulator